MRRVTPSARRIFPPVGKARGALHSGHEIGTLEFENAVTTYKHEGHLRLTKSESGSGIKRNFLHV